MTDAFSTRFAIFFLILIKVLWNFALIQAFLLFAGCDETNRLQASFHSLLIFQAKRYRAHERMFTRANRTEPL